MLKKCPQPAQCDERRRKRLPERHPQDERKQPRASDEGEAGAIEAHHREHPAAALAVRVILTLASHDVFDAIFESQLLFLEGDFFNVFRFREVLLGG